MNILKPVAAAILSLTALTGFCADPAVGDWYTVDDETGEISSRVEIREEADGELSGTIAEILKKEKGDGLCDKCPGELKDTPVEGLKFMWGLKKEDTGEWVDGQLLDPESGDVYNGQLTVLDNPDELEVRGYIGISLFGRSQVWKRAPAPQAAPETPELTGTTVE